MIEERPQLVAGERAIGAMGVEVLVEQIARCTSGGVDRQQDAHHPAGGRLQLHLHGVWGRELVRDGQPAAGELGDVIERRDVDCGLLARLRAAHRARSHEHEAGDEVGRHRAELVEHDPALQKQLTQLWIWFRRLGRALPPGFLGLSPRAGRSSSPCWRGSIHAPAPHQELKSWRTTVRSRPSCRTRGSSLGRTQSNDSSWAANWVSPVSPASGCTVSSSEMFSSL